MHKRKIAAVTMAVIISNFSSSTVSVLAHELNTKSLVQSASNQVNQADQETESSQAQVSKFNLLNSSYLEEYNKSFKLDNSNISLNLNFSPFEVLVSYSHSPVSWSLTLT